MAIWAGESDLGEDDFWPEGLDGLETDDLGDLSDVPKAHLAEVVDLLNSLPGPEDEAGDIPALRGWIHQIHRLAGFSREATIQLFSTIARCLEATRPKAHNLPTREEMQKAFVRMQGVRETINIMLMRLNDSTIVAQATRTLAAAVQGSPLAAEAMFDDGADKVRLLLRAIERHDTDAAVVENACLFISHLCSLTAWPGAPAPAPRVKAHRDIQATLAAEGGTIDLLVHFLGVSVDNVKAVALKAENMYKKTMETKNNKALPKPGQAKVGLPATGAKDSIEVTQSWVNLHVAESSGARIQELALQALLLITFGNVSTTRQLAGELWIWGTAHQPKTQQAVAAKPSTAPGMTRANSMKMQPQKSEGRGSKNSRRPTAKLDEAPTEEVIPSILDEPGVKSSLTTLDAFSKVSMLLLEVLRGRCALDRPTLAAKTFRLLSVLASHSIDLLRHIEARQHKQHAEMVVKMRPGTVPTDNLKPHAPFALIKDIISALTFMLRTHKTDAPLLTEGLSLLLKLKEMAMLAPPPSGVEHRGENLLYAWQKLLNESEQSGEIEAANNWLKQALADTNQSNERMRIVGGTPDQLSGDMSYLTPRLRELVARTTFQASNLVGDSLASKWRNGEPGRQAKKLADTEVDPAVSTRRGSIGRSTSGLSTPSSKAGGVPEGRTDAKRKTEKLGGAAAMLGVAGMARSKARAKTQLASGSKPESPKDVTPEPQGRRGPRGSTEVPKALSDALLSIVEAGSTPAAPKALPRTRTSGNLERDGSKKSTKKPDGTPERQMEEGPEWIRAIGFDTHDATDFQRVWTDPLRETLTRSLSMVPIEVLRQQKRLDAHRLAHPEEADEGDTAPLISSSSIDVQLIESSPGLLRTKLILPSLDDSQFHAAERKLRALIGDAAGSEVNAGISKHMRMQGYMMPTFGIQVEFKKGSRQTLQSGLSGSRQTLQPSTSQPGFAGALRGA